MPATLDSSIRHLPFGEQIGLFYTSDFDRAPALLPVMKSIVQGRELLVLLAEQQDAQAMLDVWSQAGYDVAQLLKDHRVNVVAPREALVRRGRIDFDAARAWFTDQLRTAMLGRHEGVRIIHDSSWVARSKADPGDFARLEAVLNQTIEGSAVTVFCHYRRDHFDSETLLKLLKAHPKIVVGQSLCENDYYVPGADEAGADQEIKSYLDRLQLRQRIREDLKSARDQFQSLVEHVPAGILAIQPPDGKPRFMNSFGQSLLGRGLLSDARAGNLSQRYQFLARDGSVYPSEQLPVIQALRDKKVFRADDLVVRRPDGHSRYIEMMAVPIFDDYGELASAVAIIEDITDRRQVEEQLLASERRYGQLLTSAGEAICVINLNTLRFITINDSFTRLLGYAHADLREMAPADLIYEEGEELFDEWIGQIVAEGHAGAEVKLRCNDGRRIVVEIRFTLVEQDPEPLALAIINDITERTELERQLREYVRVEGEQRRQLEAILDTSPMGILLFDTDMVTVAANPAAGTLFNFDDIKQYVAGPANALIDKIAEKSETTPDLVARIRQLSQDQRTVVANEAVEITSDAPPRKLVLSSFTSPVHGDENQFLGRVWIFSDLTEERNLQGQLWQAQKMESIGTLAGGVAHDFNNILVGVLGHASLGKTLLQRGGEKALASLPNCFEAIEVGAERAASLTRELLAYARGGKVRDVVIDVNRLIRDTLDIIRPSLSANVEVVTELERDVVGVNGDPGQIHQVLLNLCINASEAMPNEGALTLRSATVTARPEDPRAVLAGFDYPPPGIYNCVEVCDQGPGMSEDVRGRMYEPFFSTKGFGRGLGLAAVHGIVTNHKGYISVETAPGKGCCFRILLPAADTPVVASSAEGPEPLPGSEGILVIDQDQTVRSVLHQSLTGLGYEMFEADEPERGMHLLDVRRDEIDLVIVDLSGPGSEGERLCGRIRELAPDLPLLLTGDFDLADQPGSVADAGRSDFIQKPYKLSDLTRKIRALAEPE